MRTFTYIWVASCLSMSWLGALQYVSMDTRSVIRVELSSQSHNRIGIEGDRIKKAFFKASDISVEIEEETGQIFVQSIKAYPSTTNISLVSSSGEVQDLELCFRSGGSEIVLLESKDASVNCSGGGLVADFDRDSIETVVKHVLQGTVPEGYFSVYDPDNSPTLICGLRMERISRLVGDKQIVFIFRAQNNGKKEISVKECQLNVLDGDWVFADRCSLRPGECSLVMIGCFK